VYEASILTSERSFGQGPKGTKIRKDGKESSLFLEEAASDRICEHASERPLELSGVEGSHESEDDLRISGRSDIAKLLIRSKERKRSKSPAIAEDSQSLHGV